jgi:hypothetical protein
LAACAFHRQPQDALELEKPRAVSVEDRRMLRLVPKAYGQSAVGQGVFRVCSEAVAVGIWLRTQFGFRVMKHPVYVSVA